MRALCFGNGEHAWGFFFFFAFLTFTVFEDPLQFNCPPFDTFFFSFSPFLCYFLGSSSPSGDPNSTISRGVQFICYFLSYCSFCCLFFLEKKPQRMAFPFFSFSFPLNSDSLFFFSFVNARSQRHE